MGKKLYLPLIFALGLQTTPPVYGQHDYMPRHYEFLRLMSQDDMGPNARSLQDETDLLSLIDFFNMPHPEGFLKLQEARTIVNLPEGYQTTIPLEIRLKKIASVIDGKSKIERSQYGFIFRGDFRKYEDETLTKVLKSVDIDGDKFIRIRRVSDYEKIIYRQYAK